MDKQKLCECKCGRLAKLGNRFIVGHNFKGKRRPPSSEEHIRKVVETRRRNGSFKHSDKTRKKMSKAQNKLEVKRKKRLIRIKSIEKNNGICWPNYNPQACRFFKSFDEQNNTKGYYAMYGGGEYHIKELGYFTDYINFEKKLIIEVDEKRHFDENGNLKENDIQRQKEIQESFPDFKFVRIKMNDLQRLLI